MTINEMRKEIESNHEKVVAAGRKARMGVVTLNELYAAKLKQNIELYNEAVAEYLNRRTEPKKAEVERTLRASRRITAKIQTIVQ